ncbi:MAG: polysaccharide biosynthesis/export family protein [Acidobacteriota bacterium]
MKNHFLKRIFTLFLLTISATVFVSAQKNTNFERPVESYRIKSGDKLSIKFLNHPELNEPALTVRPDGLISLQMIDDIKAEGLTADELKKIIGKGYEETLLNAVISVNIVEFIPPAVFIGGQVGRPGKYFLREGNSLLKVIFMAGGFTRDANRKLVLYARADNKGKWKVSEVNVLKMIEKLSDNNDIVLNDGDYIFIPDSKLSKFNRAIEGFQAFFPILPLF